MPKAAAAGGALAGVEVVIVVAFVAAVLLFDMSLLLDCGEGRVSECVGVWVDELMDAWRLSLDERREMEDTSKDDGERALLNDLGQ